MTVINIRAMKAVANFVSNEETRYYLNGVNVEFCGDHIVMVATNGHILGALRQAVDEPAIGGSVIVPLSMLAKIKVSRKGPDEATLAVDGRQISIKYDCVTYAGDAIDGTFPNWRAIFPKDKASGVAAHYNPKYPAIFAKAAKELNSNPASAMIAHNGPNPAIINWLETPPEGIEACGVIMPIRYDVTMTEKPSWV